ncbi:growth factor receptor-bound protein 14 [Cricetulus griseus]|nr:growth factor receptor-bound protein 14 [Cricetulus griseus]
MGVGVVLVVEEERKQYPCKQVVTESFICKGWLKTLTTLSFVMLPLDKDVEDDGEMFHTLDEGHTKFTDLIQLVEFYQLNKGVLPCKLKHYCTRMAL